MIIIKMKCSCLNAMKVKSHNEAAYAIVMLLFAQNEHTVASDLFHVVQYNIDLKNYLLNCILYLFDLILFYLFFFL
jgi:hypothetical protein